MSHVPVENMFDDIVSNMCHTNLEGELKVANWVNVEGGDGRKHALTTQQLYHFGSILSGTHPTQLNTTPLAFLCYQYDLKDLIGLAQRQRVVPVYKVSYSADGQFLKLTGWSAPQADMLAGTYAGKEEHFEHTIRNVGLFAGVAYLQVVANQAEELIQLRMQYGLDFEFIFEHGAIRVRSQG